MIELIKAIIPTRLTEDRFRPSLDEDDAAFIRDCEDQPDGALRRVQVRDVGTRRPPDVTNTDVTAILVTYEILIAYPQTGRAGLGEARDRDRMIDEDEIAIDNAVGLHGYVNFGPATEAPATWMNADVARATGTGVDFLIIRQTMRIHRAR